MNTNDSPRIFRSTLKALLGVALWVLVAVAPAAAEPDQIQFDIPAQLLSSALITFGDQADVTIGIADGTPIDGVETQGLTGTYRLEGALSELLSGTDLEGVQGDDNSIVVRPQTQEPTATVPDEEPEPPPETTREENPEEPEPAPDVAAAPRRIEEVVVTAQKRTQTMQDVPIAVSAFEAEFFAATGIETATALIDYTPGLSGTTTGYSNPSWGIRGAVNSNNTAGSENSVAMFQDEAYIGRDQLAAASIFDVARVEVVRGPQSTLFGRNAVSGAINVITNKPTHENSLHLFAGFGNEDQLKYGAIGNLAVSDTFFLRGGFQAYSLSGIDTNVVYDKERFVDDFIGRLMARWAPNEDVEVLLTLQGSENENNLQRYHNPGLATQLGQPVGTEDFDDQIMQEGPNIEELSTRGVDLRVTWDINQSLTLTSISDWRYFDQFYSQDLDGVFYDFGPLLGVGEGLGGINFGFHPVADTLAQEFRLNGTTGKVNWLTGISYFYEQIDELSYIFSDGWGLDATDDTITEGDTKAFAVYGDIAYSASDRVTLTAGLRFTRDEKTWSMENVPGFLGFFGNTDGAVLYDEREWDDVSPRLVVDYAPTDNVLLFGSWSRGYKAGGFNSQAEDTDQPPDGIGDQVRSFDPEYIEAFEVGVKSTLFRGSLRANFSLYFNEYTDMQVETIINLQIFTDNATKAPIKGAEVELTWLPEGVEGLRFDFAYAYIDGTYEGVIEGVDVTGNQLLQVPKNSINIGANYDLNMNAGLLAFFLGYNWNSEQFFDPFESELLKEDPYGVLNGSIRFLKGGGGKWEVGLIGENLTDVDYSLLNQDVIGFGTKHYLRAYPRLVRLEFGYRF